MATISYGCRMTQAGLSSFKQTGAFETMKSISTLALTLSLAVTGSLALTGALGSSAAIAQKKGKQAAAPVVDPNARKYDLTKAGRGPIAALQKAVREKDTANYASALAAADAVATTTDEKFLIARMRFDYARGNDDAAGQIAAMENVIASGGALPAELPGFHSFLGERYFANNNFDRSAFHFERLTQLQPTNAEALANLAVVRTRQNKPADSLASLTRAIDARKASGQPVPEDWYKRVVDYSSRAKNVPAASKATYEWLSAYPTAQNWRDALLTHQALVRLDGPGEFDRLRLMRAAKVLQGERDYGEYAQIALDAGLPGEAKAVLDEGVRANIISASKPLYKDLVRRAAVGVERDRPLLAGYETKANADAKGVRALSSADAYLGYGEYAKAAALYRAALTKGGVDANVVNTRLGQALAMSGDKAGAIAAFNAVTGPRQDLARYWVLWLNRPAAMAS